MNNSTHVVVKSQHEISEKTFFLLHFIVAEWQEVFHVSVFVCFADAGAYWQSVDANKILGCRFPSLSGFSIDWCETDS